MSAHRCILHIGICKTGTTSVQYGLAKHRDRLAQAGLVIPRTLGPTHNHRHLTLLAVDESSAAGLREWEVMRQRDAGLSACDSVAAGRAWVEEMLVAELASAPAEGWVVFSSEQLSQRLQQENEVIRLREALQRLGFTTVRVVVYLREQMGLALSWESMEVLSGQRVAPLRAPEPQFNHRQLLERWENVWGREALLVRTYASGCLEQGDVWRDFTQHALQLPPDPPWGTERRWRNARLGRRGLWLLRQANRWFPRQVASNAVDPCRMRLLQATQARWLAGKPSMANTAELASWGEHYRASNQWVDRRYGTQLESTFGRT